MESEAVTPRGGVALILVPGVGDDASGDTVRAMTSALVRGLGPGAGSTRFAREIQVPKRPGGDEGTTSHEVCCSLVHRPGATEPLVVYEMHWADLSRFPGTLRRFVLTLYGLLFQVATIGLEAYRGVVGGGRLRALVRAFSYLMPVVVVGLTAGAALLGFEFAAMVRLDGRVRSLVIAGVTLALAFGLAVYGDRFLRARGWRFTDVPLGLGRPLWFYLVVASAVGLAPLVVHVARDGDEPLAVAVHEVLWSGMIRWALPVAWCLVGAVAIAAAVMLVVQGARGAREGPGVLRFRAQRTAVLSVVVSGLGVALLGALLVAAALAVTARLAGGGTPIPEAAAIGPEASFGPYATALFQRSLRPLGVALICALALIALLVVAAFRYASALTQSRSRARALPYGPVLLTAAAVLVGSIVPLVRLDEPAADVAAVVAAAVAVALPALWWLGRFGPDEAGQPIRRGFDAVLRYLASPLHAGMLVLALIASSIALLVDTPLTPGAAGAVGDFTDWIFTPLSALSADSEFASGQQISAVVGALLAIGAVVKARISPLGRALDVAYDVATYMRVPHGSPGRDAVEPPRRAVLRRYAALLAHVQAQQAPRRIVIAAHSQGTIYTLALVFRDRYRDAADRQGDPGWTIAPSLTPDVPEGVPVERRGPVEAPITLLTAGCPVLQTYAPNFPGQYDWPADVEAVNAALAGTGVDAWRNVYRSGDYIGRALWSRTACSPEAPVGALSEHCLGPGQHSGYWGDSRFARHVLELVG